MPEVYRAMTSLAEWRAIAASYLGAAKPALPATVHLRNGMSFTLEEFYDIETLWQVWFRRVYRVRDSDRAIVDAGANIGLFSAYAAAQAPESRVWAIEPFPATFQRLELAVRRNGLAGRVECSCLALAREKGERGMSPSGTASELNYLLPAGGAAEGTVPVPALTLADFLDGNNLDRVDLLKMDIEGSEYEVLGAASRDTLRRIGRLDLEYHAPRGPAGSRQTLVDLLSDAGFHLVRDTGRNSPYGIAYFDRAG
jgi:FkbM family methyltransferase